jgi:hypothetical protein
MSFLFIPDFAMAFSAALVLGRLGGVPSSHTRRSRIPVISSSAPEARWTLAYTGASLSSRLCDVTTLSGNS